MNTKRLEYFLKTGQSKSINEAASSLYISQPSLSYAIASLEKELGIKLFNRSQDGTTLTPKGKQIACDTRAILDIIDSWNALRDDKDITLTTNEITISAGLGVLSDVYIPLINSTIHKQYPHLPISISNEDIYTIYNNRNTPKHTNTLMLSFFSSEELEDFIPKLKEANWKYKILAKGNTYLLFNRRNPLCQKEAIYLEDLSKVSQIVVSENVTSIRYGELFSYFAGNRTVHVPSRAATFNLVSLSPDTITTASFLSLLDCRDVTTGELVPKIISDYSNTVNLIAFYPGVCRNIMELLLEDILPLLPAETIVT